MKEKEDKLRLVKQILVDDNDIDPAAVSSKIRALESKTVTTSDTDTRISRKVIFFIQLHFPSL